MQNFPVSSVLVKGLLPFDPTASGHPGGSRWKNRPRRTLKIEYHHKSTKAKIPPKSIEKSPCHSGTGALVAGVNGKASNSSLYFAGTQAAGAGVDTAGSTIYNCLYTSDIGLPGTVRTAMRVRNLDPESNALTTNFAFCHLSAPPYGAIIIMQH